MYVFDVPFCSFRSMYWTDWGSSPKIEKASMDGTSRTVLFGTGLRWPNGLTLDYDTQTLYWADAWLDKLESSSTDGTNRQQLPVSSQSFIHPFGLTFHRGHLYWTDWAWNAVFSAPVQNTENGIAAVLGGLQLDPMAIHVFTEERQPSGRGIIATTQHINFTLQYFMMMYVLSS